MMPKLAVTKFVLFSWLLAALSFGLQWAWLFLTPRWIMVSEPVHTGAIIFVALVWAASGIIAVRHDRRTILPVIASAPFALYFVWAVFGRLVLGCAFFDACI
jgi:hypothetical protein